MSMYLLSVPAIEQLPQAETNQFAFVPLSAPTQGVLSFRHTFVRGKHGPAFSLTRLWLVRRLGTKTRLVPPHASAVAAACSLP